MIDLHTHILPGMDDGSDSVETSIKLLELLEEQNVKLVCLTSHFYPVNESIEEYLERREKAYRKLDYKGSLELRLGSEVHYYRGMSNSEDIGKLCIEGTDILLVELSFTHALTKGVIDELIRLNLDYDVVLAHIERYDIDEKTLKYLKDNGIYYQVNAESLGSKRVIRLLKGGYIDFLGSDCHNLDGRKPCMDEAVNTVVRKYGDDYFANFVKKSYKIFNI